MVTETDLRRSNVRLTEHFKLREFTRSAIADTYYILNAPDEDEVQRLKKLANTMEIIRGELGNRPIVITSGFRNEEVNRLAKGVPDSAHRLGWACDFQHERYAPEDVYAICRHLGQSGLIRYDQLIGYRYHVHISIDPRMRGQAFLSA